MNYNTGEEVWKDVLEFEGTLEVSDFGNVRTKDRTVKRIDGREYHLSGKMLSPSKDTQGYLRITISRNNKTLNRKVHRLVAEAFLENLEGKPQVNHKNGSKSDNRVVNLEWMTSSENNKHAHSTGLNRFERRTGEKNPGSKLTEKDVLEIKSLRAEGFKYREIAERFPVSISHISLICKNKYWK